ncbi:response regulator [Oceanospirillum maris]|uniref:response regulator n=1 Tax=Oceanospirillum maris TaxID=64977 RepID=UPI000400AF80|nr:response regulator [Oceanospirillum maris]
MQPYQILLIEDEDIIAGFIEHTLAKEDIQVTLMSNAEHAWEYLRHQSPQIDAILLDRGLPGMDGIEFLHRLKRDPELHRIPVIVETAAADQESIQQGIDAGAYYYLVKPLQRELLLPIVMEAANQYRNYRILQNSLDETSQALGMLHDAQFNFRTLAEARLLTNALSKLFPEPKRVSSGLLELLINAVEHGNLAIDYEQKTHLLMSRTWHKEIEQRLRDPHYSDRHVSVHLQKQPNRILLTITDEGEGFDWQPYLDIQPERVFHLHGRGIAMARRISFDSLEYQGCGNSVQVAVHLG